MTLKAWISQQAFSIRVRLQKVMKCIWSGQQGRTDETVDSSESLATRDFSASGFSSRTAEAGSTRPDDSNIEEAESSLRESGYLNYEEARALLGRLEYQKGNIEAALQVFEGIDITVVTSKMKLSLSRRIEPSRRNSQSDTSEAPMSMHAISLLLEAIFLKAKSLKHLGRFKDAAQSCRVILDIVESALPEGVPETISVNCKLQEILNKSVGLLPKLCKLAGAYQDAILAYRRALLYRWNLDAETAAKIQKEFAVFLLYSGVDAKPPNLRWQTEGSFVPRNNIEEAVLLLVILVKKLVLKRIPWDPSIIDHLSFALSVSGELRALAEQVEKLHPGSVETKQIYLTLAFCYYSDGQDVVAFNLLKNLLNNRENHDNLMELLLVSKICGEKMIHVEEGLAYIDKAISESSRTCNQMMGMSYCLKGVLLSAQSRLMVSDTERSLKRNMALEALETAQRIKREQNPYLVFHLCVENAEQRKLEMALHYAKLLLRLEAGSSVKAYLLLCRILSAQKRYVDADAVVNAAIDQSGKWDQAELLQTKAKLEIAQGRLNSAIKTYTCLLADVQVRTKSHSSTKKLLKSRGKQDKSLEIDTWHSLANIYTSLSQWRDAEFCLSKSKSIDPYSANRYYSTGLLNEAKGNYQDAFRLYQRALDIEPKHIQSLISTARILRQLGSRSLPVLKSLLTDAIRLDRTNHSAWYTLGLVYKTDPSSSAMVAAECFEAAALLEDTAPIESFR